MVVEMAERIMCSAHQAVRISLPMLSLMSESSDSISNQPSAVATARRRVHSIWICKRLLENWLNQELLCSCMAYRTYLNKSKHNIKKIEEEGEDAESEAASPQLQEIMSK